MSQPDYKSQLYFLRTDSRSVIKSQAEYDRCKEHHIEMKTVSYNSMVDHLNKEEAAKRRMRKRRAAGKLARKQRKLNARRA